MFIHDIKEKTCCFTGHRVLPAQQQEEIKNRLEKTVIQLIKKGFCRFLTGGALGFDTVAAQCVLSQKQHNPQIKLILILPCPEQTKNWSTENTALYHWIKSRCDGYLYLEKTYTQGCMFRRNRCLVDHSAQCICYLQKQSGGTYYTVSYAKKQGVPVINLANSTI